MTIQSVLTWAAAFSALLAAGAWFISTFTVSMDQEIARRKREAKKRNEVPNLGGMGIVDGGEEYDLIATLRHQGRWNRVGSGLTAISVLCQAAALFPIR